MPANVDTLPGPQLVFSHPEDQSLTPRPSLSSPCRMLGVLGKAHDVDEVDPGRDIVKREENLHTRSKLLIQVLPK